MGSPTLTIGQLAAHVGVTVRAIRHYHQRGLLAEPARDASGYRRYDAQAVVDLIRVKTLSDAGVPLGRIEELLGAQPEEFAAAIAQIDDELRRKIRDLTSHRHRIAQLAAGERLFLPAEVADILCQLRALGVSERGVRIERDAWILVAALAPELIPEWVGTKKAAMADPEFRRLYLACDEACGWDPADPRLEELAEWMADWSARNKPDAPDAADAAAGPQTPGGSAAVTLTSAHVAGSSPAWQRLRELSTARRHDAGDAVPDQR